jgi:signal transduction histidine kinase
MVVFGAAIYTVLNRQRVVGLNLSLERAVYSRTKLVLSRDIPTDFAQDTALYELPVFVFDVHGMPYSPKRDVEPWLREFALNVLRDSIATDTVRTPDRRYWLLYGKRFRTTLGNTYATVAQADLREIRQRYPSVVRAFVLTAILAILLVAVGGVVLAQKSTAPIERTFDQMRRFMGDAAHELKTPVAVLRARADVALQRGRNETEYQEILNGISSEAKRLGSLVENMLLLARADAGQWPVSRQRVFLDDVLLDAASAARALGAHKHVDVEVGTLEESPVNADPDLLRQLLMILLDNAVSFTPEGGHVTASAQRNGRYCKVTIEDTGPGIPTSALPHIFDRFYRADPARGRAGAGLGLSIARWIVDEHNAHIQFESTEGRGTTVRVEFPSA